MIDPTLVTVSDAVLSVLSLQNKIKLDIEADAFPETTIGSAEEFAQLKAEMPVSSPLIETPKKKRGRPLGSKNKPKLKAEPKPVKKKAKAKMKAKATIELPKKKLGRPLGSKNKPKLEATTASKPPKKVAKKVEVVPVKIPYEGATTGQSGPALTIGFEDLNAKERKVIGVFDLESRAIVTIVAIAKHAWPTNTQGKSNSWTRNSLRRLVRGGLVEKVKRGLYRITVKGRNRVVAAQAAPAAA